MLPNVCCYKHAIAGVFFLWHACMVFLRNKAHIPSEFNSSMSVLSHVDLDVGSSVYTGHSVLYRIVCISVNHSHYHRWVTDRTVKYACKRITFRHSHEHDSTARPDDCCNRHYFVCVVIQICRFGWKSGEWHGWLYDLSLGSHVFMRSSVRWTCCRTLFNC